MMLSTSESGQALDKAALQLMLTQQLTTIFESFRQGLDVSPSRRYKWEGVAELALASGLMSGQELLALQQAVYGSVYTSEGSDKPDVTMRAGKIPVLMVRAPVKPSTKD